MAPASEASRRDADACQVMAYDAPRDGEVEILATDFAKETRSDKATRILERIAQFQNEVTTATQLYELEAIWQETKGKGIRVAVLDNGIDEGHPAFARPIERKNFIPAKGAGGGNGAAIERYRSHGTHCAGIIAARRLEGQEGGWGSLANIVPFSGIAPEALLLDGRVMREDGSGQLSVVAEGVQWAIDNRADIISLSIQGRQSSDALYRAIQRALENGVLVICGAGNYGQLQRSNIGYPGRYGGVLTVASHSRTGQTSEFSASGGEIDISAPGQGIWSTVCGGYGRKSGTSMAAPFVAGIAALILAKHRDVDARALRLAKELRELAEEGGWDTALKSAMIELKWHDPAMVGATPESPAAVKLGPSLLRRIFDHYAEYQEVRHRQGLLYKTLHRIEPTATEALARFIDRYQGSIVYNRTPLRNNEDLKDHLLSIASHPGYHDQLSGYGALWPARYFGVPDGAVMI
jgi:major intracellular serine protease